MKIHVTDVSPVKKTMSIEVGPEAMEQETEVVLRRYSRKARIPGFRPGKAPLSLIRARFSAELQDDVRDRVVARYYHQALEERGIKALGDPTIDEVRHEKGEGFRFTTTFEVRPEFEVKGYRGVEVRRPAGTIGDEDVDRVLEDLRRSRTQLKTEEGRAAGTGDVILADVEGEPEGGEAFRREATMLEVGATGNLPAFNEKLEGARAGAELEFSVDYPAEYGAPDLAGKTVRYRLKVREVKRAELPELDDEFARDLGDFDDLAGLRRKLEEDLRADRERAVDGAVRQRVLDKVLLENPILLPEVLVEQAVRSRLEEGIRNMIRQGMDPERAGIDWVALRKSQEEPARRAVHAHLLLDAVAVAEKITVDDDEVEERIRQDARRLGEKHQKLRAGLEKQDGLQALKNQMVREKSLDLLASVANIQNEE